MRLLYIWVSIIHVYLLDICIYYTYIRASIIHVSICLMHLRVYIIHICVYHTWMYCAYMCTCICVDHVCICDCAHVSHAYMCQLYIHMCASITNTYYAYVHLLCIHVCTYLTIHKCVYLLAYVVYYDIHNVSIPNKKSHSFIWNSRISLRHIRAGKARWDAAFTMGQSYILSKINKNSF